MCAGRDVVWPILGIMFAISSLLLVILLPLSFQAVNFDEVGISYYIPSHSVAREVKGTGI